MKTTTRLRRVRSLTVVGGIVVLLACVALVLQLGGSLRAPPALGERWAVEGAAACLGGERELVLSQSGTWLRTRWTGDTLPPMHGRLALDGTATLELVGAAACGTGGRLSGRWTPEGLDATLTLDGCAACPTTALRALPVGAGG